MERRRFIRRCYRLPGLGNRKLPREIETAHKRGIKIPKPIYARNATDKSKAS